MHRGLKKSGDLDRIARETADRTLRLLQELRDKVPPGDAEELGREE